MISRYKSKGRQTREYNPVVNVNVPETKIPSYPSFPEIPKPDAPIVNVTPNINLPNRLGGLAFKFKRDAMGRIVYAECFPIDSPSL